MKQKTFIENIEDRITYLEERLDLYLMDEDVENICICKAEIEKLNKKLEIEYRK